MRRGEEKRGCWGWQIGRCEGEISIQVLPCIPEPALKCLSRALLRHIPPQLALPHATHQLVLASEAGRGEVLVVGVHLEAGEGGIVVLAPLPRVTQHVMEALGCRWLRQGEAGVALGLAGGSPGWHTCACNTMKDPTSKRSSRRTSSCT